jgi:hypothetical protein
MNVGRRWFGSALLFRCIVVAILLVGCGAQQKPSTAIVGTWASTGTPLYEVYTFAADGGMIYSLLSDQQSPGTGTNTVGTYEILDDHGLVIRLPTDTRTFGLSIDGNRLRLTSPTVTNASGGTSKGPIYDFKRVE